MNKQTFSIEFSFDVDAGTIDLLDDDKWCVNQLIAPEVFIERYRNYKLNLMDKTHIDKIAQQVLQIANRDIKNAFGKNGGCVRDTRTEFTTEIDHVQTGSANRCKTQNMPRILAITMKFRLASL